MDTDGYGTNRMYSKQGASAHLFAPQLDGHSSVKLEEHISTGRVPAANGAAHVKPRYVAGTGTDRGSETRVKPWVVGGTGTGRGGETTSMVCSGARSSLRGLRRLLN
jgi:hypothetical protein